MVAMPLIRRGGLLHLLSGLSLILLSVYDLAAPDPAGAARPLIHSLGYLGLALGLLGLTAVYLVQQELAGRLGLAGYLLAFVGNVLTAGAAFLNGYVAPVAPELFAPTGPLFAGPAGLVILLSAVLVTAGFVMFGIATLRAGVLPRWAAILVVASAWFGLAAAFAPVAFHLGGILFGLGNAGLGYAVWAGAGEKEMER